MRIHEINIIAWKLLRIKVKEGILIPRHILEVADEEKLSYSDFISTQEFGKVFCEILKKNDQQLFIESMQPGGNHLAVIFSQAFPFLVYCGMDDKYFTVRLREKVNTEAKKIEISPESFSIFLEELENGIDFAEDWMITEKAFPYS